MTNFDIQRESEQIEQGVSAARKKLLQAAENRFQYQVEQSQQPAPVYYDGRNRIKPLGANNSYSARGIQANAPLGVGDRVAEQGGLVQATPNAGRQAGGGAIRSISRAIDRFKQYFRQLTIEDIDIVLDDGNDTYPIITSSSSRYTVLAITSSGTGTGALSPAIDAEIAVGGTLDLTLSGNDDTRWSATIRLRRRL